MVPATWHSFMDIFEISHFRGRFSLVHRESNLPVATTFPPQLFKVTVEALVGRDGLSALESMSPVDLVSHVQEETGHWFIDGEFYAERKLLVDWERKPDEVEMAFALEKVAREVGVQSISAVAIAYVMQKTTHVFPILGGRKVEHLEQNLQALDLTLSAQQMEFLESQVPLEHDFPQRAIGDGSSPCYLVTMAGNVQRLQPTRPPGAPQI
ncbi:putative aryl-alcohol dehydrogenase aad14 [Marasmius tenuissimus]|nr:putative aryl-alcohol dehydrogenase aad14 [Marasmius tenuissimus]